MFFHVKLKPLLAFLVMMMVSFSFSYFLLKAFTKADAKNILDFTIVLDAGHGGMDGGSVGVNTKVKESELNLNIVKKLEPYLKSFGFGVVLTRYDHNGLYNQFNSDYKLTDMQKRKEIIQKANANIMVSIHLNSYPASGLKGAQAFYMKDHEPSKLLADTIQKELFANLPNARQNSNFGDYYILKCTQNPSVMVECGFLSNAEEELLLQQESYQEQLAYTIFCGIVKYFYAVSNTPNLV